MADTEIHDEHENPLQVQSITPRRWARLVEDFAIYPRTIEAACLEADVAAIAGLSQRFVRGFELSKLDGAIITNAHFNNPQDPTVRTFAHYEAFTHNKGQKCYLPIDVKSVNYTYVTYGKSLLKFKKRIPDDFVRCTIKLTADQKEMCQALIIASGALPGWVAFMPMAYFVGEESKTTDGRTVFKMSLGMIPPAQLAANPMPPMLAPFMMPETDLPEAIENYSQAATNPDIKVYNPFSRQEYTREITFETYNFEPLMHSDVFELQVRHKIYAALEMSVHGKHKMRNPTHSPHTADIRIDHAAGSSVFIEVKNGHCRVRVLDDGRYVFEHMARARGFGKGIFTDRAEWDYLLTFVNENEAYLILKDDIPSKFWHKIPSTNDGYLTHTFSNSSFLDTRRVFLNNGKAAIASAFARILTLNSTTDEPTLSSLTAADINEVSGPCPVALFQKTSAKAAREFETDFENEFEVEEDVRLRSEDPDDGNQEIGDAEVIDEEQSEDNDGDEEPRAGESSKFGGQRVKTARERVQGGLDSASDSLLFQQLMKACRKSGKGVMIDFGKDHKMGRMAMKDHTWSEEEKAAYDGDGTMPITAGECFPEDVFLPIVVLVAKWRWDDVPEEPTLREVECYVNASPCIVIANCFYKEFAHLSTRRYVLPTEFLPTVQFYNMAHGDLQRACLHIEKDFSIEEFVVDDMDLHATLYQFLTSEEDVTLGLNDVKMNPTPYLKFFRDFRLYGETHFDECFNTLALARL